MRLKSTSPRTVRGDMAALNFVQLGLTPLNATFRLLLSSCPGLNLDRGFESPPLRQRAPSKESAERRVIRRANSFWGGFEAPEGTLKGASKNATEEGAIASRALRGETGAGNASRRLRNSHGPRARGLGCHMRGARLPRPLRSNSPLSANLLTHNMLRRVCATWQRPKAGLSAVDCILAIASFEPPLGPKSALPRKVCNYSGPEVDEVGKRAGTCYIDIGKPRIDIRWFASFYSRGSSFRVSRLAFSQSSTARTSSRPSCS